MVYKIANMSNKCLLIFLQPQNRPTFAQLCVHIEFLQLDIWTRLKYFIVSFLNLTDKTTKTKIPIRNFEILLKNVETEELLSIIRREASLDKNGFRFEVLKKFDSFGKKFQSFCQMSILFVSESLKRHSR